MLLIAVSQCHTGRVKPTSHSKSSCVHSQFCRAEGSDVRPSFAELRRLRSAPKELEIRGDRVAGSAPKWVVVSDLTAMASNLIAMASNLEGVIISNIFCPCPQVQVGESLEWLALCYLSAWQRADVHFRLRSGEGG